jgi:exopolysaccharide biosynthesis polyprenyl glycosylphosphotransferase
MSEVYSRRQRKLRLFFGLADVALVWAAYELAYQTRSGWNLARQFYIDTPMKYLLLLVAALAFLGAAAWFGTYERLESARRRDVVKETLRQTLLAVVIVVMAQFLLRLDVSRAFLGLFGALSCLGLLAFRSNAGPLLRWFRQRFGAQHYVMIAGTGESARRMARLVEEADSFGMRLLGFLEERPAVQAVQLSQEYPVHALGELPQILRRRVVDEVIFAVPAADLPHLEETLLLCDEEGVRTRIALDIFPHVNSDVYLDRLGPSPLLTFSGAPHDELRLLLKRATDIFFSALALLVLAPFLLLVAIAIRMTSPGPVIFSQIRCGLNGRRFRLYKFRSMVANAEALKQQLMSQNERELVFKIRNDPRLTPIGKWLRKFSVDELPQLWNVLIGDMSIVGPRPAIPEEVEQYKRWQRRRLRMRPGLTCLWVVEGRDTVDFETWMTLDMRYIDNWSLALDWKIILRTIPQVVIGRGAH